MEEVYKHLYVGGDIDYDKLKGHANWSFVRACKEGPGGHRETLGYTTLGAPKDKNYLYVRKGNRLAINILDLDDPNFMPDKAIEQAFKFIDERLEAGDKVLVACNQGRSRGPSIAMLYMRRIGDLPSGFHNGLKIFRTIYHPYDPGIGMRQYTKSKYSSMNGGENE